MITSALVRLYQRMLNAFENDSGSPETDYASIYIYHDGNGQRRQVTLARGFTDDGGSLKKVVERYISKGGAKSELFRSKLDKFGRGTLVDNKDFINALKGVASEPAMRQAQDEIFEEVYLQPALSWAETHQFVLPLSVGVIVDSYLHSGGMPDWLMKKFPESKPDKGGDEKAWIQAYLRERLAWFERVTGALHNTTYRPNFFIREISKGNWDFKCPLIANGANIC